MNYILLTLQVKPQTSVIDEVTQFVTTLIDGGNYVQHKLDAMKAHETQISTDGPFFALSNNLGLQIWGDEYYTLVLGDKAEPFNDQGRETDLFAGVNL